MLFLYLYIVSILSFPITNVYRPLCDESKLDLPMSFDEGTIAPVARFAGYQDLIIDLPTIGLETIKNSIKAGLKGIFVKKGKNVFLQRDKCIKLADKHNFFISVF